MKLTLKIWRQQGPEAPGRMEKYEVPDLSEEMSFLEMLDVLNERLIARGEEPVAFDHDCREGICGACGFVINGHPHGKDRGITVCQLHMRKFKDGETVYLEPWRASAFPVIKDLVVDRTAFDRIITAGGFISVRTGQAPDANALPIACDEAEASFDAAACIGCGACVASCKNASAMLFVGAKVSQFALLPQGRPEAAHRVVSMVEQMDAEGFGNCTNEYECSAACPKEISATSIARLNREFLKATVRSE